MKCSKCGAEIADGLLYCGYCGTEVQMVPDYNPLDEMLAEQVREDLENPNRNIRQETGMIHTSHGRTDRMQTNSLKNNVTREQRKKQSMQRKAKARKKRRILISIILVILLVCTIVGVFAYRNSYSGLVNQGYKQLEATEYQRSEMTFKKAIKKNTAKPEAYIGLSKVYIAQDDIDTAEQLFLDAIIDQPDNVELYEAILQFYVDTDQESKIAILMEDCENDEVLDKLKSYISERPQFSLPDDAPFDDVQELSITAEGAVIYFTVDGSEPSEASEKYTQPIQLEEGTTQIRAIAVNKKGIPSVETSKTYQIELPIQDAPAVTPSTGQYEKQTKIEIRVPEGCTAYYTLDGSTPNETSTQYSGEIDMPEGSTLFSAVLIDGKGRISDVTKRNYELTIE